MNCFLSSARATRSGSMYTHRESGPLCVPSPISHSTPYLTHRTTRGRHLRTSPLSKTYSRDSSTLTIGRNIRGLRAARTDDGTSREHSEIDGLMPPAYRTGGSSPFARSRIPVLKKLIELRQKGSGYHRTHLGQILNGNPLSERVAIEYGDLR